MVGEWRETTLDQLGRIVTGKTPPSSRPGYFGGDIPFVTPTDFDGRRVIGSTGRYLTEEGENSVSGSRIPAGAVMVSCIGSDMGKTAVAARDCVTNQQINSIVVDSGDDPLFVYYNLSIRKTEIRTAASGSAQPILNKSAFGRLDILLPSRNEQRAIAYILGTLDDKIELNRRMNGTLEAMARAIFKSWFVDAIESGIPKGWTARTLGDMAENPRRTIDPSEIEPETPYIGLEHMPRRSIALAEWGRAEDVASGKARFRKGEILFGKLRPYFHKVGVAVLDGVCSTDVLTVRPKAPERHAFVLCLLSSNELIDYADACSTGTKMPRVSWTDLARYEVVLPPAELATKFNVHIQPMLDKIIANIMESRTLAALRDALLPKLLSAVPIGRQGEVRVKDAGRFVERAAGTAS